MTYPNKRSKFEQDTATYYHSSNSLDVEKNTEKWDEELLELRQRLDILRKILGENDVVTASCHHNIGSILLLKGQYDKAMAEYCKALEIYKKTVGEHHRQTAQIYEAIGHVALEQCRLDDSLASYCKSLVIRRILLGDNHLETAKSYHNVGLVLERTHHYKEALDLFLKAHDVFKRERHELMFVTSESINRVLYAIEQTKLVCSSVQV